MNDIVVRWCRAQKIEVTRSRAYKKNDQAFVEQKNGAVVRRLVGYGRFDGIETAKVMARLYAAARLHVNYFQPSFKLKEKRREGARVIKRYHLPATPYERALRIRSCPRQSSDACARPTAVSIPWRFLPRSGLHRRNSVNGSESAVWQRLPARRRPIRWRLAVHLSADAAPFFLFEFRAIGVHAHP